MELGEEETLTGVPMPLDLGRRHAFLVALDGPQLGEIFLLERGRELLLGRWASADVRLPDRETSRRHARLLVDHTGTLLTDLASQNGTWVNGQRVPSAILSDGDRISLGGASCLKYVHADTREARYLLQLAEAPRLDAVTGLPHGPVLERLLLAELAAARRRARPVSLLAVGVDPLPDLPERMRRQPHDDVLLRMASALRATLRKEDQAAAFSGGRVYVLARDAEPAGVRALAQRIRAAVSRSGFAAGRED
jgi:diguanylate cyclase (GGDEF)-like protein